MLTGNTSAFGSDWFAGIKGAQIVTDADYMENTNSAGMLVGYVLSGKKFGSFAIDVEYVSTIKTGNITGGE